MKRLAGLATADGARHAFRSAFAPRKAIGGVAGQHAACARRRRRDNALRGVKVRREALRDEAIIVRVPFGLKDTARGLTTLAFVAVHIGSAGGKEKGEAANKGEAHGYSSKTRGSSHGLGITALLSAPPVLRNG